MPWLDLDEDIAEEFGCLSTPDIDGMRFYERSKDKKGNVREQVKRRLERLRAARLDSKACWICGQIYSGTLHNKYCGTICAQLARKEKRRIARKAKKPRVGRA